jgi:hypothetical protein
LLDAFLFFLSSKKSNNEQCHVFFSAVEVRADNSWHNLMNGEELVVKQRGSGLLKEWHTQEDIESLVTTEDTFLNLLASMLGHLTRHPNGVHSASSRGFSIFKFVSPTPPRGCELMM